MKPKDHPPDAVELRSRAEAAFRKKAATSPENLEAPTPEATRQLLHELREKEERLSLATLHNGVGIWDWNLKTQELIWDDSMFSLYHIDREEFIGTEEAWRATLHPDDLERGDREVNDAISGKKPFDTEFRVIWPNGEIHHIKALAKVFRDEHGTPIRMLGTNWDITERRQAEQLLAWEKDALELISRALSLPEVLDGLMLGLEKQLPDSLCSVLLLDDDGIRLRHGAAPSLPAAYNRAIDGATIGPAVGSCGTAAYTTRQVIVADIASDPFWDDYRELALGHGLRACWSTPILCNEGKVLGTFAIYYREPRHPLPAELALVARALHITRIAIQRKQADEALRESEQKFRTLFENAGDAIFLLRGERFADCNVRALEMFGCHSRDEFVKHPPYEFSPPFQPNGRDSREFALEKISAALDGRPQFFEWVHTKPDGRPFPAEVSLNMVEVSDKVLLQGIVRDISDRKRAEDLIRRQNTELETRVEQRTADLSKANKKLRRQIVTRRKLEQEILKVSEREQKRIGQDLHDDLGQQLAGIWCLSQLLESSLASQKSPDATSAAKITRQLKESLELTRTLAQGLHPVMPQADGLSSALDELARKTSELFGVNCRCKCPQRLVMDNTIAMHLYRIAQESVTNAAKHGHAKNIEIQLSANSRQAILSVDNDGMPMAEKRPHVKGMGLRIMKYRADMMGGRLSIRTNKDSGGTIVTCTVPAPILNREI